MQRKEPSACLVHSFCDKVSRIYLAVVQQFLIFERIMNLRIRHSTRIEPNVNQIRFTLHRLTVFRHQYDIVYIRTVKVNLIIVLFSIFARNETFILVRVGFHKSGNYRFFYFIIKFFYRLDTLFICIIFRAPNW